MSLPVIVLPEARSDIVAAREFLESCSAGLGDSLAVESFVALDRVGKMPEMYGEVCPGVRAVAVRRFGYVVYYRVLPECVEVIAVLHGARDPIEWQRRI